MIRNVCISEDMVKDIDGLTGYIFETELDDFIEQLTGEPLYVEEDIITVDEAIKLAELNLNDPNEYEEADPIIQKACKNNNCRHIYALAWRMYMELLK